MLVVFADQPENVQICRSTVQKRDFLAFFDYFFKSRKKFNKRVKFYPANQIFQKENHAGQKKNQQQEKEQEQEKTKTATTKKEKT